MRRLIRHHRERDRFLRVHIQADLAASLTGIGFIALANVRINVGLCVPLNFTR
jgi:hypothetical protein